MTELRAIEIIQEALDSLHRIGLTVQRVDAQADTVLFGAGSPLDSIGFVTFITEMEDRLSAETGREIYLIIKDIHEFSADTPYLTVGKLASYIANLSAS